MWWLNVLVWPFGSLFLACYFMLLNIWEDLVETRGQSIYRKEARHCFCSRWLGHILENHMWLWAAVQFPPVHPCSSLVCMWWGADGRMDFLFWIVAILGKYEKRLETFIIQMRPQTSNETVSCCIWFVYAEGGTCTNPVHALLSWLCVVICWEIASEHIPNIEWI